MAVKKEKEVRDLAVIDEMSAAEVYSQVDAVISIVRDAATKDTFDVTTAKGKKAIASMAYKVAQTKTFLDGLGKDMVSDMKAKVKTVDADRKKIRDSLDQIKAEVRKPLTDIEEAEKKRVDDIAIKIQAIADSVPEKEDKEGYQALLSFLEAVEIDDSYMEFKEKARVTLDDIRLRVKGIISEYEEEEREQEARDEKIRKDAAEKATRETEERIARENKKKVEKTETNPVVIGRSGPLFSKDPEEKGYSTITQPEATFEPREAVESYEEREAANREKILEEIAESMANAGIKEAAIQPLINILVSGKIRHVKIDFYPGQASSQYN